MTSGQEELGVQSATGSPGAWSAAIVVSHRIGLSAASPYVEELIRLRFEVVIYCLGDFEQTARSLWPNPTVRISGSDALSDPKWAALYRRAAESLSRLQPGLNPDQQPNWSHRSMPARRRRPRQRRSRRRRRRPSRARATVRRRGGHRVAASNRPVDAARSRRTLRRPTMRSPAPTAPARRGRMRRPLRAARPSR